MATTTTTATYLDPTGEPCKGRVVFRLVAATYQDGLAAIFPTVPVSATLDDDGAISVELEPTSGVDAAFDVDDMTYQVWERINGTDRAPYYVDIPTAPAVDLGTLATYDDPPLFVREFVTPNLSTLGYPTTDTVAGAITDYASPLGMAVWSAALHPEELATTVVNYNPAGVVQTVTDTSQAWTDIDATNLVVSFVAPPSGKVIVTLSACAGAASGGQGVRWRLYDTENSSGINESTVLVVTSGSTASNATSYSRTFTLSRNAIGALTPGRRYSFKWQHRAILATTQSYTEYGGTANDGAATIRVTDVSNRPQAKTVTAVVESSPNYNVWDVAADNLHMVGTVGPGIPATVGRLAFSSDAGANWTVLANLHTPSGTGGAWFAGDGEILVNVGITGSAPGKIYKSTGWATDPASATFAAVQSANDVGGLHTVYFGNYAGIHQFGGICVMNEYGPKASTAMARYVYATQDYGDTWTAIFDLHAFILEQFPAWDGNDAHTHGSVYDPWWDAVWVVTGDYDGAGVYAYTLVSFDWRSDTPTWHIVYRDHQFTSIIPMPGCVLFGTDQGTLAADGIGNGLLRYRRQHPGAVAAGVRQTLEGAFTYDTTAGVTVIGRGYGRQIHNHDAPALIGLGRSAATSGVTGRIVATHDGFTFKEIWTASDTGTTGAIGPIVMVGDSITAPIQQAADSYNSSKLTLTLS